MSNTKNYGFTLLELLIVIAVIGLLGAVTLVTFPGAVKRAKIAQGWVFSDTLRASLQGDMVGWWAFNESSGTTAKDSYTNQLDGTVSGAQWKEGIVNNALEFDSSDVVVVNDHRALNNYVGLTLEAWIKPTIDGGYDGIVDKYYYPGACYQRQFLLARWPTNRICFWMGYNNGAGAVSLCTANNSVLAKDGWVHVAATWSRASNTMKVYLNGKQKASYTNALNWTVSTTCNLQLGRYYLSSFYVFNGLIDEVRIYSAALKMSTIQQHYAEGLKTHQNLAQK